MKYKNLCAYEQPLEEGWQALHEQQQQEGPVVTDPNNPDPNANPNPTPEDDDPFKGINTENLDDATKAIIEKARITHATTLKSHKELNEKIDKVTKVASQYQSVADRANARLKEHNLSIDGNVNNVVNKTPEELQIENIEQAYIKRGMKPEVARQTAELMSVAIGVVRPDILREVGTVVGPMVGAVNNIRADQYLNAFATNPDSQMALKIPGVAESARVMIDTMISNRTNITQEGVTMAINMALGEALMKSGGDLAKFQAQIKGGGTPPEPKPSFLVSLLGGSIGGPGNFIPPNDNRGGGLKHPVNDETIKAGAVIGQMMDRQLKKS